ncbi:hypothetical protein TKK_0002097 [Trichogramma kaykai]
MEPTTILDKISNNKLILIYEVIEEPDEQIITLLKEYADGLTNITTERSSRGTNQELIKGSSGNKTSINSSEEPAVSFEESSVLSDVSNQIRNVNLSDSNKEFVQFNIKTI